MYWVSLLRNHYLRAWPLHNPDYRGIVSRLEVSSRWLALPRVTCISVPRRNLRKKTTRYHKDNCASYTCNLRSSEHSQQSMKLLRVLRQLKMGTTSSSNCYLHCLGRSRFRLATSHFSQLEKILPPNHNWTQETPFFPAYVYPMAHGRHLKAIGQSTLNITNNHYRSIHSTNFSI